MEIGVPKEIKNHEYRVGLVPSSVRELTNLGHKVYVQSQAGSGIGITNEEYESVGATILPSAQDVFSRSEMIIKVKEPQPNEYLMLKEDQILLTYLHLAPDPEQAKGLVDSKCVAIAYETVTDEFKGLPLLAPMSEVAGRMSVQVAAQNLEKEKGGAGILLGGVPGVQPARVVVLGGGVVGMNAAKIAAGMGADVTILDKNIRRLNQLDWQFDSRVRTIYATTETIESAVIHADVVVGAVLVAGAAAPRLVTAEMVKRMRPGSVMVDVAIDQGGCFETSRPTTHTNPTYVVDGVIHYCVTNMPGAVARTSTFALNNATLPHVLNLANKGYRKALMDDIHLRHGLNVCLGHITHPAVSNDLGFMFIPAEQALAA